MSESISRNEEFLVLILVFDFFRPWMKAAQHSTRTSSHHHHGQQSDLFIRLDSASGLYRLYVTTECGEGDDEQQCRLFLALCCLLSAGDELTLWTLFPLIPSGPVASFVAAVWIFLQVGEESVEASAKPFSHFPSIVIATASCHTAVWSVVSAAHASDDVSGEARHVATRFGKCHRE
jgi:hypothetical protein